MNASPASSSPGSSRQRRKRRMAVWSLVAIVTLAVGLPLGSYGLHWAGSSAVAQEAAGDTNPRSNYWRAVREGVSGYSAIKGQEANVLMQAGGSDWQSLRDGKVAKYLPWVLVGMLAIISFYHLLHGRINLDERPRGRKVKRWSALDRLIHWTAAGTFMILAVTGLSMLVGKSLLIPLLGPRGFALWAQFSMQLHNIVGPVFSIAIGLMIILWIWHNIPNRVDMKWFAQAGGLFGKQHPSAGRFNGGEKLWFWSVAIVGVLVCISGLVMVAPIYGIVIPGLDAGRPLMQQANLVHGVLSMLWAAAALSHIYIGTAGSEGSLEGMATGYVSEEWARQHHDLWFEAMAARGKVVAPGQSGHPGSEFHPVDSTKPGGATPVRAG